MRFSCDRCGRQAGIESMTGWVGRWVPTEERRAELCHSCVADRSLEIDPRCLRPWRERAAIRLTLAAAGPMTSSELADAHRMEHRWVLAALRTMRFFGEARDAVGGGRSLMNEDGDDTCRWHLTARGKAEAAHHRVVAAWEGRPHRSIPQSQIVAVALITPRRVAIVADAWRGREEITAGDTAGEYRLTDAGRRTLRNLRGVAPASLKHTNRPASRLDMASSSGAGDAARPGLFGTGDHT